jgi:hypothetical protein
MESFQQKVSPISFGAFEDIFDWKEEETTRSMHSPFFIHVHRLASLGGSCVLRQKIQHTRAQIRAQANEGTSKEKETTFRNDVLFWRHLMEVKKSRITMLPWQTDIIRISIINTFESPQGILWDFLWGTVRSTVSRIYLKRLVLLLMQLSQRKMRRFHSLLPWVCFWVIFFETRPRLK